jgi:nucleotide-binding universal stress UspA family protein
MAEEQAAAGRRAVHELLGSRGYDFAVHVAPAMPGQRVWEAILDAAVERGAIAIALASRGESLLRTAFIGSTALRLLAHSHLPILMTGSAIADPSPGPEYRIVFATDGSSGAEAVARASLALLSAGGPWRATVQHVLDTAPRIPLGRVREQRRIEQFSRWFPPGVAFEHRLSSAEASPRAVATALCDAANDQRADAIALSSHGFRLLRRVVAGSVGTEVLRLATTPVLLAR